MKYQDLISKISFYRPISILESIVSHNSRLLFRKIFFVLAVIMSGLGSGIFLEKSNDLTALSLLTFCIFLIFTILDVFYYSNVFENDRDNKFFYELSNISLITSEEDFVGGFIRSRIGRRIILRAGISNEELKSFLTNRKTFVNVSSVTFSDEKDLIVSYLETIYSSDQPFQNLLISRGLNMDLFIKCSLWVLKIEKIERAQKRWWSQEILETVPSLARDWAYGKAYTLMKMSTPLRFLRSQIEELHDLEISRSEIALARSKGANILLVGSEGIGKMEVVEGLARKIIRKKSLPHLFDKHFFVLDNSSIRAHSEDGSMFEKLILNMFSEAIMSGNTIIVIPDMADFLDIGSSLRVNVAELIGRFLSSTSIHIIGIVDTDSFHQHVEKDIDLVRHFSLIMVEEESFEETLKMFLDTIHVLESRERTIFTYTSLLEVVSSAKKYFPEIPLFDRSSDLLIESASLVRSKGGLFVTKDDVKEVVQTKTGIHTDEISKSEGQLLENLEKLLHERVVGQDEAISGVSDALRRARIGVNDPDRPVGSFLFLGPTGVGKTETAKALSEVFFGHETELLRLNMSEFSSQDSVNRLIGSYNSDSTGILSDMIREHGYGVLLLDEFEKTSPQVLDLFLQILDEGMFQDALGRKVNARNLIIVATSNAGSDYIFEVMKQGKNLMNKRDDIVNKIIIDGIFKPELLNRFDAVVLFHPLGSDHVRTVAKTMLDRLAWRLKDKGLTLIVNDAVLDFLVSQGRDEKFGARTLNRAIQDNIEKKIADRIISGQYKPGSTITFTPLDFA